ncbi:hypothetical protein PTSG_11661 [Salpingoeca rosetta]|uniref:DNA ligase n=1 Tax=Salpingoeca rosetta (strain ATCC 50818 / BSB-021) TaxID=946362 RepID=F2TXY4_SALR5|nr:uncharacterized protein PTSG_11661 [Salpingoeca rosetta]EGD76243.1 hypothetical protein PTSG_11661 [Salpingoeca rosetta]|eukprot:XP_004998418.1 hypothetical protein PTSG_11661 [Salpingoeca rosetta]
METYAVPFTPIVVDHFNDKKYHRRESGTLFFLSHFHADHYGKLNKDWQWGPVYCSQTTAKLVAAVLEVDANYLRPLPLDTWVDVTATCRVALIDANHCPGAAMFLFHVRETEGGLEHWYLHSGDCRYTPAWKQHPLLQNVALDILFLDTTYCDPKHTFPPQEQVVRFVSDTVSQYMHEDQQRADGVDTLFLVATYSVGKEKILTQLVKDQHKPLVVSEKKRLMMQQLDLDWPVPFDEMFTSDHLASNVHVVGWHMLGTMAAGGWTFLPDYETLHDMIDHYKPRYHRIVAFVPTGWTYVIAKEHQRRQALAQHDEEVLGVLHHKETKRNVTVFTVPYSEHSNYLELREFVAWLKPARVVPTVIGGGRSSNKARLYAKICSHFDDLIDKKAASRNFLASMLGRPSGVSAHESDNPTQKRPKRENTDDDGGNYIEGGGNDDDDDDDDDDVLMIIDDDDDDDRARNGGAQHDKSGGDDASAESQQDATDGRPAPATDESVCRIQALLGADVSRKAIAAALAASGGDAEKAVNILLDSGTSNITASSTSTTTTSSSSSTTTTTTSTSTSTSTSSSSNKGIKQGSRSGGGKNRHRAKKQKDAGAAQMTLTRWLSPRKRKSPKSTTSTAAAETRAVERTNTSGAEERAQPTARRLSMGEGDVLLIDSDDDAHDSTNGGGGDAIHQDTLPASTPATDATAPGVKREPMTSHMTAALTSGTPTTTTAASTATTTATTSEDCEYLVIASTFEEMLKTKSRLKITELLKTMLCTVLTTTEKPDGTPDTEALIATVYLSTNSIAPSYRNVELGIGERLVAAAVRTATGRSRQQMRSDYKELGDLGDVAFKARSSVRTLFRPRPLQIKALFRDLHRIAVMKGPGSVKQKQALVHKLLVSCRGPEIRFLVRTLISNLRIGAVGLTLQVAVGHAIREYRRQTHIAPDEAAQRVKDAYARHPCWETILTALLSPGCFDELAARTQAHPGVPVRPMLGKITRDLADALERLRGKNFQAEFKYDGVRAQIHIDAPTRQRSAATLHMFSRHLENMTDRYPDALESVLDALAVDGDSNALAISSCVLDAEIVAVTEDGTMLPFQTLMNRARKNVDGSSVSIRVRVHLFDIMHHNGASLLKHPFRLRRKLLQDTFTMLPNRLQLVTAKTFQCKPDGSHSPQPLREFLHAALDAKCEGLMIKVLGPEMIPAADDTTTSHGKKTVKNQGSDSDDLYALSTYQPSKRCENWLKVKKDYVEGLSDSLDLVVIGAWWGNGRKAGWFSPFLLACYDEETETYQSVCKVMSGFTDEFYKTTTALFKEKHVIDAKRSYYDVSAQMSPSVWFDSVEVWEIKGADFTASPAHTAARGAVADRPGAGISLRFPRFIRKREDKTPEEATTSTQISELYHLQFKTPACASAADGDGDGGGGEDDDDDDDGDGGGGEEEEEEDPEGVGHSES